MSIAFLSDIHGNSIALECLLNELNRNPVDEIYFLGDAVNYYPDCNEVVNLLRENKVCCIKGNHDFMVTANQQVSEDVASIYRLHQTRDKLTRQNFEYLDKLPICMDVDFDNVKIHLVHGSPSNELEGYLYPDSDLTSLENLKYDFIFCGHTHRAMVRKVGNVTIANPGSIGMPRDIGNKLSYLLFDSDTGSCTIKRLDLPVKDIKYKYGKYVHPTVVGLLDRR